MDAPPDALLTREVFGNVSDVSKVVFYFLSAAAVGVLGWRIFHRLRRWQIGKPNVDRPDWRTMLGNLWRYAVLQRRVRGRGSASAAHLLLVGGFGLLLLGTTLIGIEHTLATILGRGADDPVFHKGLYYVIYEPVLELAGLALLVGSLVFGYRRWKRPPEVGHEARDWVVLGLFVAIGVTGYALEGLRIVREDPAWPWLSFGGAALADGFRWMGLGAAGVDGWHVATWWFHAALSLGFIALFPYSRLLHAIAGSVRLASGVERPGTLSFISLAEVEATGEVGVARVEQFTRRRLVELDACVSCGRCDQACPALEAGKPLAPRLVVQDIRRHLGDVVLQGPRNEGPAMPRASLVGEVVHADTLWSCTACTACVDVCPLGVSPLGFILEMRRSFVADAQLRGPPAQALQKTDRTGNPWGLPAQDRMAWAADLSVPTIQENPGCEVLYWVGCAAAYDRRLQKVARSVVKLLRAAGVNFAVLGKMEVCTGESARRMGDELLFQQLAGKNIETFAKFGIENGGKRIVSHCPHCVNSFRQDYSQMGANLTVSHHSEFLDELVRLGRLPAVVDKPDVTAVVQGSITYHDPCYLARVGELTAEPRNVLNRARRGALVEMPRHGRQTSCCGAGGGRMWFDDTADQRVGRGRVAEALATGAQTLAVSCPFCLTMTSDGLASRGSAMAVRDIAEILADALPLEIIQKQETNRTHGL